MITRGYGPSISDAYRQAGIYTGRTLSAPLACDVLKESGHATAVLTHERSVLAQLRFPSLFLHFQKSLNGFALSSL
jgi:hypothetical protein